MWTTIFTLTCDLCGDEYDTNTHKHWIEQAARADGWMFGDTFSICPRCRRSVRKEERGGADKDGPGSLRRSRRARIGPNWWLDRPGRPRTSRRDNRPPPGPGLVTYDR